MPRMNLCRFLAVAGLTLVATTGAFVPSARAEVEVTAFKQAVAEAAARDADIAAFYRDTHYQPIWTGTDADDLDRRQALLKAIETADDHGLPVARYDFDALYAQLRAAHTPRALGMAEVALSKAFLAYARDIQSGMFVPTQLDDGIKREAPRRDRRSYLTNLIASEPNGYLRSLAPRTPEYVRLLKEKLRLEQIARDGGWGPKVRAGKLETGDRGPAVVALRDRLVALGYLERSATAEYDTALEKAVQAFQLDHGLEADGVAGDSTISEINRSPVDRLKSVMVAMERERWLNKPRGERHVLVNLTDFHARIVDHDRVTFKTRSVIGKNVHDQRSPEFSDVMEHMVINPTWNVPRSIATKEYLPMLQRNPNAVSYLKLIDGRGRTVDRGNVDFSQYSTRNFPFDVKQPPGANNALGLVKFMFPNRHNIYLHDTPSKSLFAREVRAFSHGCIRLQDPFEFAYALLARQESDPESFFHTTLKTGRETQVDLKQTVPVHIIYRTAFTNAKGPVQYRRDIYGRDAKIWRAMVNEGVVLRSVQG